MGMSASDFLLTVDEFASLKVIGAGLILGADPIPSAHLGTLVRLRYIFAVFGGYEATASGARRIASGV
jgi:hypothetical protein